ncbi:hypothetical protein DB88DRAFT_486367 [Papiliotrema laurentii]|uniref:Probable quinone oxidoreductase n=1 Tax=Papiliotrema laurentii TaxID=5418 RepID=A0AAD9L633_PAPLA|nr:hypothetical protein DB88DRAFT_486367 [Papiliotrema laurentii]
MFTRSSRSIVNSLKYPIRTVPLIPRPFAVHIHHHNYNYNYSRAMSSVQIPKTQKAIRVHKNGGPEVNVLDEIPVPTPGDNEVLIKVEWTGVNFIDNYFRNGLYPKPLPYIVGQDAVGTLVSLPSNYTPPANTSLPPLKVGAKVLTTVGNSHAEYVVAPVSKVAPLPEGIDEKDAVGLTTTAFTAIGLVEDSYKVKKGDWVLVRAASGGVGTLLVQLAAHAGANVIGTVSSEAKVDLAKQNGAHHVLLTSTPAKENNAKILELTGGLGVHVVYDGVGKDTWEENFEVIRRKGTIVTFGNASGPPPEFSPLKLSAKSLKVTRPTLHSQIATQEEFVDAAEKIFDAYQKGALKITIHKVYGFSAEEVAQAQTDIASRSTIGKLVIKVA